MKNGYFVCIIFFLILHLSLDNGSHPPTSKIKRARATPLTGEGITKHHCHPFIYCIIFFALFLKMYMQHVNVFSCKYVLLKFILHWPVVVTLLPVK